MIEAPDRFAIISSHSGPHPKDASRPVTDSNIPEIKKLREGTSIWDKTILQLQSQVNHATSYLSSRIQPNNSSDISSACSLLNELVQKLTSLADKIPSFATPSVSVYNNWHDLKSSATVDKSTQTSHLNSSDTSSNSITPQTNLSVRIESAIETFNKETQNSSSLCNQNLKIQNLKIWNLNIWKFRILEFGMWKFGIENWKVNLNIVNC